MSEGATIRVGPKQSAAARIHPYQYGQFVEYLCDLVPGMWAEKLYDASFEGPLPYHVVFRKETDFREKLWYPVGDVNRGDYILDGEEPFNGAVSLRISVVGEPATVGIAQEGIAVEKGRPCRLSVHLRSRGAPGTVRAQLRSGTSVLARAEFQPGEQWKRHEARLDPSATTTDATLALEFRGPGTVWIDQASLMPEETVGGWRPDVVEALKELKPGIIRFGGSTIETFDWKLLVGDPERRPPWPNDPWGGRHPSSAGLEELLHLCRAVDAEPLFCIRVTGRTPQDAADQVEYFNGGAETPMGRMRAENGRREPYGIRYWQVGNELGGEEYARRLAEFCAAMRKVDPAILLLSAYPSEAVLREAGSYLDYVCPHHYGCADLDAMAADFDRLRRLIAEHGGGRAIRVGVTEWNTTGGDFGLKRAMLWSLDNALACSRYQNLLHRYAGFVEIANRSNLVNSFCSGILQTDNARLYKTPTYYAQQLYARLAGSRPLPIEVTQPIGPYDAAATISESGDRAVLFVVNGAREPLECRVDLSAFGRAARTGRSWTLLDTERAGERDAANSFPEPERIRTVSEEIALESDGLTHRFPGLSLTALEMNRVA